MLDEADKMLSMDFESEINLILENIPKSKERQTLLFSATMTTKVSKLQKTSLINPFKIMTNRNNNLKNEIKTAKNLIQKYIFIPSKFKLIYLVYILKNINNKLGLIFCSTCDSCELISILLSKLELNYKFNCLHGKMKQVNRLGALKKFKDNNNNNSNSNGRILVATDVASRGLDIPNVDFVINFDVPTNSKDYIHRVGRTARANKYGKTIIFITQYDIELFQRIEKLIGLKLKEDEIISNLTKKDKKNMIETIQDDVEKAKRLAINEIKIHKEKYGQKRRGQVRTRKRRK